MATLADLLSMLGMGGGRVTPQPAHTNEPTIELNSRRDPEGRRMVSAPNNTLRGKRMDGARPMTEQERTITEEPWKQMGRDVGAFSSQAVNAAGLGIPGLLLEMASPDLARAVHDNESRATGMANVGGVAAGMVGPGGLAKEGTSRMAALLARHPAAGTATIAGAGTLASPSEAGRDAAANDYIPKSLISEAGDAVQGALKRLGIGDGPSAEDKPLTLDDYKRQRATLKPKTLSDLEQEAVDKLKSSDERYKAWGPAGRAKLEAEAREGAKRTYAAFQQDAKAEEGRLEAAYNDYRKGWDKQRAEHLNKQFTERHPTTAMAMTVGGPIASALLTKGAFSKINSKADDIVAKGLEAREADEVRKLADQITRADQFGWRGNVGKGIAAGEAVLLPAELRMMQDVIDKKGLPPESGARKAAERRMSDVVEYGKGMGWDLFSGAAGAGTGALWSKIRTPYPGADLATLKSHARGMDIGNMAPDSMAAALASRARIAREAQDSLSGSSRPAIAGPEPRYIEGGSLQEPGRALPAPSASAPASAPALPPSSQLGALPAPAGYPNPSPVPARPSSPARSLADALADKSTSDIIRQLENPAKPRGGSHPDHEWVPEAGRWRDAKGHWVGGPPPKDTKRTND